MTLRDTPQFTALLNKAFYETDIPMVLSYFGYAFHPDLPVHRVLFILGRERIGKGTCVRVIQGLIPKGSGSISLGRLLTSDRFQFSGIEGKNLLVDSETKRKFRRGTVLDWSTFCNLFGKDVLPVEPKGKEVHDYVSKAKGIFLGNLPFIPVDSPPAVARVLIVETRNERPTRVNPNLDLKIPESESDSIATLLVEILFKLEDRDFVFPGQLTDEATTQILEQLSDPVSNFIDEQVEGSPNETVEVDHVYSIFIDWCQEKGMTPLTRQTFVKKFGQVYQKRKQGPRGQQVYCFVGCHVYDTENVLQTESKLQVGYGADTQKTLNISISGDRYRRIQHMRNTLRVEKEKDLDHDIRKGNAQKLATPQKCFSALENKHLEEPKPVANLTGDPLRVDNVNSNNSQSSLINTSFRSGKGEYGQPSMKFEAQFPITIEAGDLIKEQLIPEYIIDPNSGPDMNRRFYKLGIHGVAKLSEDGRNKLFGTMEREHFKLYSDGAFGILWYVRPLKRGESQ